MTTDPPGETGPEGPVSSRLKLCTKCRVEEAPSNSSWCRGCRNEQAAEYRARTRPKIRTEVRVCAWEECGEEFVWSSKSARQVCCSKSCYGKYRHRRDNPPLKVAPGKILCTRCDQEKLRSEFAPSRQHLQRSWCRECSRSYQKEWDEQNVGRRSASTRRARRRKLLERYGAPCLEFEELLQQQGGRCAICGSEDRTVEFHIDHDHNKPEAESYRGILCGECNKGLGAFRDDPVLLLAAVSYIVR